MKQLAVLGPNGTYSTRAIQSLEKKYDVKLYPTILKVCTSVDIKTDGLIPFENTLDGFVMEGLDSIIQNQLFIREQVQLDVNFSFVSNTKDLSKVKEVYVQFKAYGQCLNFITKHNLTPIILQSNMESYEKIKNEKREDIGAIIPIHIDTSCFLYHLDNVADSKLDQTRFVRLTKDQTYENVSFPSCCSAIITPIQDSPGVLFDILEAFKKSNLNLSSILSRPRRDIMGNYIFYVEFLLEPNSLHILKALKDRLEKDRKNSFTVIGIYNRLEVRK